MLKALPVGQSFSAFDLAVQLSSSWSPAMVWRAYQYLIETKRKTSLKEHPLAFMAMLLARESLSTTARDLTRHGRMETSGQGTPQASYRRLR